MKRMVGGMLSVLASCLLMGTPALVWADEADNQVLRQEIAELRARLGQLESRLGSGSSTVSTADKPGAGYVQLPSGLQDLQISGYADVSYIYNFASPDAGVGRTNRGRFFDTQANGFTPQAFELALEKPVSDESPIGFRTDLFFGDDAELSHSAGLPTLTSGTEAFDLQQAYVALRAPVGAGVDFKVGKFVTLIGAEASESPANWNFSRSFLFGFAEPATHTGALVSYPVLGEYGSAAIGLVNGWDTVDENNQFKTMLGNIAVTPLEGVSLAVNGITGAERAADNGNDRTVIDLVATWNPIAPLTLMAHYDYGHESSVTHGVTATAGSDSANWHGLALYAKYDITPKWALAGRWEYFNDMDNVRTGFTSLGGGTPEDLRFTEYTLTSQWVLHEHLLARLEYRHDQSNERVFFTDADGFTNFQDTIAAELVCHF